ncbi:hypothetical protein ACIQ7D_08875 [Streptomyces sp. NPDC096310]|uniref:hypothetical protein n=1 Tax=Streptomyces sp. NPDC096310 TaxID=3366082 RepID=UPI0037F4AB4D
MSQPPYPPASDGSGAPRDRPAQPGQAGQPGQGGQPGPYSLPPQPQAPPQGAPVEGNPYAQPAPPPPAYGGYQGQGHQGYQGAPPPYLPQPPQPPHPGQRPGGRRRAALLAGAVAAVVLLAGGGVWLATGGDGDGSDGKDVAASSGPSGAESTGATEETGAPETSDPETDPETDSETSHPEPSDAGPTGTGMEGMWRSSSGSGVLGVLKGEDVETIQKDSKITMVYVKGDLECKGLRTVTEPGKKYRFALICSRDDVPVESEDRSGDFTFFDGALSVAWTSGGTGTETFDRYADAP